MAQGTLKETALETTCELCGSVTDELCGSEPEYGPRGLYVCPDCYDAMSECGCFETEEA